MRKAFFVIYCPKGLKVPKMYKSKGWLERTLLAEPSYSFQAYVEEDKGIEFLRQKLIQFKNTSNAAKFTLLKGNLQSPAIQNHVPQAGAQLIDEKVREQRERQVNQILTNNGFLQSPTFKSLTFPTSPSISYQGFFDGASRRNPGLSSAGFLIRQGNNKLLEKTQALGIKTNNEAEMIGAGLLLAHAYCNDVQKLRVFGDSKMTIDFLNGKMRAWRESLINLLKGNEMLSNKIRDVQFKHIDRRLNLQADELAALAFPPRRKNKGPKSHTVD